MKLGNEPAHPASGPVYDPDGDLIGFLGMTKREVFAGLAMQASLSGILSCPQMTIEITRQAEEEGVAVPVYVSSQAVLYADALLVALAKPQEDKQ